MMPDEELPDSLKLDPHGRASYPGFPQPEPFVEQKLNDEMQGNSTAAQVKMERTQALLNKKLGPEYLATRAGGGGMKLTYVEGWKAINLANEVFGFNGKYSAVQSDIESWNCTELMLGSAAIQAGPLT
jgi:hypothetical protein